jgi:hypothetical protein
MHLVSFQNDGLIDLRSVLTFGASVKEHSNPIGFFGTGLKYALAVCARLKCKVTLFRGLERYDFGSREVMIRNAPFDVVTMTTADGTVTELGFTSELGKTWQPWQCFRELYCNTRDERGDTTHVAHEPAEGKTTMYVEGVPFYEAYLNRKEIVLEQEPDYVTATVHIHDVPSNYVYYRGVRIHELSRSAKFTYDLYGHIDLTEDRTAKHAFQVTAAIRDAVLCSTQEEFIKRFVTAPKDSHEAHMELACEWTPPSETFMRVMSELPFAHVTSENALKAFKRHSKRCLRPDATPLTRVEEVMLERALNFVEGMGYAPRSLPLVVTTDLPEQTWGIAYDGTIFLNRSAFQHGTKVVAGTVLEETLHLLHQLPDESRVMQNHLLNALMSMAEQVRGEPL